MRRLGIDVGGTFTDVVLFDGSTGEVWSTKVPTTPSDPAVGALNGLRSILDIAGATPDSIDFIGHGTTIATNMIIEGKGAKTGLVTTKGFRDILEIRRSWRHDRADLYDLFFDPPPQLVPRYMRHEVDERVRYDGSIDRELDEAGLDTCIDELKAEGAEAIAVCMINSPVNDANERRVLEQVRSRVDDAFVTGSIEVNPEIMEYERTCTTVVNAILGPRCGQYAGTFTRNARELGITGDIYFMQSNGGLTPPESISERPVTLLESGPAGGVTGAARLCERMGVSNAITGDMGGTSFDVSLIRDHRPELRNSTMIKSYTVRCPNIDIISIGAGGGSIAWIDEGGGVRIGPESAGADPGPACYGRGGTRPTVTDCNLVLGYVDASSFLGGDFALDVAAAESAIRTHLADPLGVSIEQAALTVRHVANALMAQAVRLVTVERGYDPRDFVYIPFGGAGPVHAVDLARELDIPTVILPPMPGVFSAFGMLVADMLHDFQRSITQNVDDLDIAALNRNIAELEEDALRRMDQAGISRDLVTIERRADCQYLGQGETIQIEVPAGQIDEAAIKEITANFVDVHRRHWNFDIKGRPVRLVNLRVRVVGKIGEFATAKPKPGDCGASEPVGNARVRLGDDWAEMPRYRREQLRAGERLQGPLVVEEPSTRIVIYSGDALEVHEDGTIVVSVSKV